MVYPRRQNDSNVKPAFLEPEPTWLILTLYSLNKVFVADDEKNVEPIVSRAEGISKARSQLKKVRLRNTAEAVEWEKMVNLTLVEATEGRLTGGAEEACPRSPVWAVPRPLLTVPRPLLLVSLAPLPASLSAIISTCRSYHFAKNTSGIYENLKF